MNQYIIYTLLSSKTLIEEDFLVKTLIHPQKIDKPYIQDEIEILELPEFILINHHNQCQIRYIFPAVQFKIPPLPNITIYLTTKYSENTTQFF